MPNPCTANQAVLIDPVASNLVMGGAIVSDNSQLASASTFVQGAATDGVTQLLLQIPASNPGDSFSVEVLNENFQLDTTANDGGLFAIGAAPSSAANTLTVTAANTSPPMAFAAYAAPTNFYRGTQDASDIQRTIAFQVSCSSNSQSTAFTTSFLVRPPVVLIHGLWSSADDWSGFGPLISPQNTTLWGEMEPYPTNAVDYSSPVSVSSTSPSYSNLTQVAGNALGFSYNAPYVLLQLQVAIHNYGTYWNAAAVQADVVAHSMGGDIARTMPTLTNFLSGSGNYNLGFIHKLITIGTPHTGTQLATNLLPNSTGDPNSCVRNALKDNGFVSLLTATVNGGIVDGGVGDLQATSLPSGPFPIAYIAGSTIPSINLANLDAVPFSASGKLYNGCGAFQGSPLALLLTNTPSGTWNQEFSLLTNDAIVPVRSQVNGTSSELIFTGIIHSQGIEKLDFAGPSELDPASGIPDEVINLLNEQINGSDFFPQSGGGGGGGPSS
jgi:pimeloyl-ACP methyl ester carboxylesterase